MASGVFTGFVVSDYTAINELVAHGTAENEREAARQAFSAGVDMDMQSGAYDRYLGELLSEGKITEAQIDDAVKRVLRVKFILGLFDDPFRHCDPQRAKELLGAAAHRETAYDMACKSMVLLKNGGQTLPPQAGRANRRNRAAGQVAARPVGFVVGGRRRRDGRAGAGCNHQGQSGRPGRLRPRLRGRLPATAPVSPRRLNWRSVRTSSSWC